MKFLSLDQLEPGQKGKIIALKHDDFLAQRLMEMGLLEGEVVEMVRLAPMGDPMEIRVAGYNLSIRRSEASLVEVEKWPA